MKKVSDFIIYSNLLISICAACLIWETYILLHLQANFLYISIGFVATLFTYNIDRLVVIGSLDNTGSERHNWLVKFKIPMIVLSALCVIFLVISMFYLSVNSLIFLAHLGLISVGYSVPALINGAKGLRNVKLLKIFLIMYVWAATTVFFPAIGAGQSIFQRGIILLFIERAFFIFAITLPFDIRDYASDKANAVLTIPGLIGISRTRLLAFICILAFFMINAFHYPVQDGILWAKLLSGLNALIVIYFARDDKHEYYFTGLIDSAMIIQFLLVLILR